MQIHNTEVTIFDTEVILRVQKDEEVFENGIFNSRKRYYPFFVKSLGSLPKCLRKVLEK